ncbi:MAG: hypothetical protein Cons2KO_24690 [Congregibacter sp.]
MRLRWRVPILDKTTRLLAIVGLKATATPDRIDGQAGWHETKRRYRAPASSAQ